VTDNLPASIDPSDMANMASAAMSHNDVPAILSLTIPIVAIVFGIGVAMLGMWLDFRKKREMFQLHHAERMAAIEKGVDIPPLPPEFFQGHDKKDRSPYAYFRRGVMWLLIGIAATAALWGTHDNDYWWGLVPAAVGVAYLITFLVERGRERDSNNQRTPL
jgi:uncharacterized protein DUF6249